METLAQWLIVLAVALGWVLGRFGPGGIGRSKQRRSFPVQLPAGVRFTFENYSDDAIDKYVQALEVSVDTLPMHLSIASHFRKKGEVERAILIHQNLLANPLLDSDNRERATFELARDYMSAGLLDRAEALLKQLERSRLWGGRSLQLLLDIFQDEKEWGAAKQTALKLDYRKDVLIQKRLAHYCCEEAEVAQHRGDWQEARRHLREAAGYDRSCVRVSFMYARLHAKAGEHQDALSALHRIEEQDARFLPEIIALLVECYGHLGQEAKLQRYLALLLQRSGAARILIAYCNSLRATDGDEVALAFMAEQLNLRPSVKGLDYLIALQIALSSSGERRQLQAVRQVTQKLLHEKPLYLCEGCGFSGRILLWLCPSCKQWETIKPVQGVEGD